MTHLTVQLPDFPKMILVAPHTNASMIKFQSHVQLLLFSQCFVFGYEMLDETRVCNIQK